MNLHPSVIPGGALSPEEITRKLAEGFSIQIIPPSGERPVDPARADFERIVDEAYDEIRLARSRYEQPSQITLWGLPIKIDYAGRLDEGELFRIEGGEG